MINTYPTTEINPNFGINRWHCAWAACSRLYVKTWGGQSYCGGKDCPASRICPEYGPRS